MSAWISARAVADHLGVSERTVRRWCTTGRITGCWQPSGYRGGWLVASAWLEDAPETVAEMSVISDGEPNATG